MGDPLYYQERINAELRRLEQSLNQAKVTTQTVELDQSSVGRLTRMDALQQQAMARGMLDRILLRKKALAAALARIDAARFGQCCQCDGDIDFQRLDNDPATVFCYDCMAERAIK